MSSKDELFDGAIHRGVVAQTLKQEQYAQSGKRDARPYVERDRCIEVPLELYRQRTQAWIDNAPYEDERWARMAYQEAFEAAIKIGRLEELETRITALTLKEYHDALRTCEALGLDEKWRTFKHALEARIENAKAEARKGIPRF